MPRAAEIKANIEAQRLELIHTEQKKLRRRLTREIKVKKANPHLPGDELLKKQTAVLLKIGVPGISYTDIANRLGEHKSVVKGWFREDPDVKEFYDWAVNNLKEGALELMKTYSLEAVETLVILMRFGSEKYMFEAAREILDRVGVPKVERHENQNENINSHKWADRDELVASIRELPPEQQEQAIVVLEKFEELLANSVPQANGQLTNDGSGLEPIMRDDDINDVDVEDEE